MSSDSTSKHVAHGRTVSTPEPLRFVNLDHANLGRDPGTKKLVRSHVMQRYRRGKAMKPTPAPTPTQSPLDSPPVLKENRPPSSPNLVLNEVFERLQGAGYACSCVEQGASRRRSSRGSVSGEASTSGKRKSEPLFTVCTECGGCVRAAMCRPSKSTPGLTLGAGKSDPFDTLPLCDQTQSFYLLDHYSHVVLGLSLPMNDHQIRWFKRALADEGLLHSLLLYAAKHNEILTGTSREVEIYGHRGEVMRIITERIRSGRDKLIDTTIDTVACLVLFEEMFGIHAIANAHRAGLEQLVSIRGGLEALGVGSPLYKLVVWARTKHSTEPIWEMAGYHPLSHFPIQPYEKGQRPLSPSLPLSPYSCAVPTSFDSLHPIQIEIFSRLRNSTILVSSLSLLSRSASPTSTPPLKASAFTSKSTSPFLPNTATAKTAALAASLENNEQYVLKARVCEELAFQRRRPEAERRIAWLVAALLYATTVLSCELRTRSAGEQRGVVEGLVGSLRAALTAELEWVGYASHGKSGEFGEEERYAASVLLWMLFVGGVSVEAFALVDEERWFGGALREVCMALGLSEWGCAERWMKDLPMPGGEEGSGGRWPRWWERIMEENGKEIY